jgi:hypothetical protein
VAEYLVHRVVTADVFVLPAKASDPSFVKAIFTPVWVNRNQGLAWFGLLRRWEGRLDEQGWGFLGNVIAT